LRRDSLAAQKVERALNQLELFKRRQIYVAFSVRVGETGPIIDHPGPETLRSLFACDRAIVSIVGAIRLAAGTNPKR
jgi:hypothetical protein